MEECVFCQIVAGRAPASVVYRDEACIAFMDITPVNASHLLIVPIAHATFLADLDPDMAALYSGRHSVSRPLSENQV